MNKIHWLWFVLAVCLLPYLFYFAKPGFVGVDSWANFNYVCGVGSYVPPEAWGFVLDLFVCDVWFVKLVQFVSYFVVIYYVVLLGRKVFEEDGWKLGVLAAGLCPLLFQISLNFEAQWFGFVVAWIGFVGFVNNLKFGRVESKAKALFYALILLFGCFLWGGSWLLFGALSFYWIPLLIITIPIAFLTINRLFTYALNGSIFSNQPIMEEMPIVGATPTIFLWPFLNKTPKGWLLPTLFLFIVGMIKVKYMFLAVPFLAMGLLVINNANKDLKILGKFKWPDLVLMSLVCSIAFGVMIFYSEPTQEQLNLVELAIKESQDKNLPLYNDWSTGWWFESKGFDTNYKSSYPEPDYNSINEEYIAFTMYDINKSCTEKAKAGKFKLIQCN